MKKYFLFITVITLLFSCKQKGNKESQAVALYDSLYMPAVFTDSNRLDKIKAMVTPMLKRRYRQPHLRFFALHR